jgi:DNA-binding NtrC family response regulator
MQFSAEALQSLLRYPWPGNVRELENTIERSVILADGDTINSRMLGLEPDSHSQADNGRHANLSLDDYFVQFVHDNEQRMSETELSKQLGISRKTLWERRQKLGIPRKR